MILEIKSPKWISLGYIQGGGMAALHLEAPGSIGFLAFPASRGHLHSMAPNPGVFPSSEPDTHHSDFCFCGHISFTLTHSLTSACLPPAQKDL